MMDAERARRAICAGMAPSERDLFFSSPTFRAGVEGAAQFLSLAITGLAEESEKRDAEISAMRRLAAIEPIDIDRLEAMLPSLFHPFYEDPR